MRVSTCQGDHLLDKLPVEVIELGWAGVGRVRECEHVPAVDLAPRVRDDVEQHHVRHVRVVVVEEVLSRVVVPVVVLQVHRRERERLVSAQGDREREPPEPPRAQRRPQGPVRVAVVLGIDEVRVHRQLPANRLPAEAERPERIGVQLGGQSP